MNATQLLVHFDRLAEAPDAVPRLRRFILDLAVRGKLVEQDAGDEPAAKVLKRIQTEKSKGDKRQIAEAKFAARDAPCSVPLNWVQVPLIALGSWAIGAGFPKNEQGLNDCEYFFLKVSDMNLPGNEKYITTSQNSIDADAAKRMRANLHPAGTIIFPKIGGAIATNKRRILTKGSAIDNNCLGITFSREIDGDWAYLILTSLDFTQYQVGTAVPALQQAILEQIAIGLPPIAEQHRIVAKVDELMALCDQLEAAQQEREHRRDRLTAASLQRLNQPAAATTAEAQREYARFHLHHLPRLTTRPEHIKAMRQLLVNLAVAGKLAQPELNDEPAEVLLKKVWAEKKSRGLLKPAKKSREGNIDLTVNSLPAGWVWTTFESFATEIATGPFGSALHQSDYIDGGIPLVNPSHMIDGRIVANPKISVTDETANGLASYRMKSGDVVMARRGEVGRAAIVTDAEAGWLCGTGSFFVSFHEEIDRQFVILLLRSDAVRRYLAGEAVGTTMVNLNHGILKRIPSALPPAAEQHRIVAKVDELMALCDQFEAQLTTTQTDSRRLLEAVLDAALAHA